MSYIIRSSPIGGSDLKHAYVDFDGPIGELRGHIRGNCSHILDRDFVASISEVDRITSSSGVTRIINTKKYLELLDMHPPKQMKSAA